MNGVFREDQAVRRRAALHFALFLAIAFAPAAGRPEAFEKMRLPASCLRLPHPHLVCSSNELANLRSAWADTNNPGHAVVAGRIRRAEKALGAEIDFPPRGGRHTPWYQCQKCQTALRIIDESHHKCPICGKVYSGAPYDDVLFTGRHHANLAAMNDLAWAWVITGRKEFADRAGEYLKGYALRYRKYPFHGNMRHNLPYNMITGGRLFGQTLEEAYAVVTTIAPAYDLVHDSGRLSEADHELIREGLLRPMLKNIRGNFWNSGNWHSWHNAAMFWGGALLHEEEWIDRALNDRPDGFRSQMRDFVTPDGMWFENSWGYHFYALQALAILAEGARHAGLDLWADPHLRAMFKFPADCAMEGGILPRFGDDTGFSLAQNSAIMETGWNATHESALAPFLSAKPIWETVLYGRAPLEIVSNVAPRLSVVYPQTGYAILHGAGSNRLSAAITFGPHGGYHGHFDKLSFVFYGFDSELAVDPGRALSQAYQLPIHKKWYRGTISHNTVLVDGQPQEPAGGRLDFFQQIGDVSFVSVRCDEAYPGVSHRRLLALMPGRLLVADYLVSRDEHRFDWLYHGTGTAAWHTANAPLEPVTLTHSGAEFMRNVRGGKTDLPVTVDFQSAEVSARLIMNSSADTGYVLGEGPFRSIRDLIPLVMVSRSGREVLFAAVIEPVREGVPARTADIEVRKDGQSCLVSLRGLTGQADCVAWDLLSGAAVWTQKAEKAGSSK
jgi:hypothetical protein